MAAIVFGFHDVGVVDSGRLEAKELAGAESLCECKSRAVLNQILLKCAHVFQYNKTLANVKHQIRATSWTLLPLGEALQGGCGCAYWIFNDWLNGLNFLEGQIPVFPMDALMIIVANEVVQHF